MLKTIGKFQKKFFKQKFKQSWRKYILPAFLVGCGLGLVALTVAHAYLRFYSLSVSQEIIDQHLASPARVSQQIQININPVHIQIDDLIDVDIEEHVYRNGIWTVSSDKASFLSQSALPGSNGNIIIYGHNKASILGNLRKLKGGEVITITTANQNKYLYKVSSIYEVATDRIEFLQPTQTELLTVYTCSGFLDKNRFIVRAEPIE